MTTEPADLGDCDLVIEAIVEDLDAKGELLATLAEACAEADIASTTSSLRLAELATAGGATGRLFGLHVFNPVSKMELVELCLPAGLRKGVRERALAWCGALGKTAVEVPDQPGFVVNRLLFPFLFEAVRLIEATGMRRRGCRRLHAARGRASDGPAAAARLRRPRRRRGDRRQPARRLPPRVRRGARASLRDLVAQGKLGRKSGAGFYSYE